MGSAIRDIPIRRMEYERGYSSGALPYTLLLATLGVAASVQYGGSWLFPATFGALALYHGFAWWLFAGGVKRHDRKAVRHG